MSKESISAELILTGETSKRLSDTLEELVPESMELKPGELLEVVGIEDFNTNEDGMVESKMHVRRPGDEEVITVEGTNTKYNFLAVIVAGKFVVPGGNKNG